MAINLNRENAQSFEDRVFQYLHFSPFMDLLGMWEVTLRSGELLCAYLQYKGRYVRLQYILIYDDMMH